MYICIHCRIDKCALVLTMYINKNKSKTVGFKNRLAYGLVSKFMII